jgi:hypothetical protein
LDWSKATGELGFAPTTSAEMMLSLFIEAMENCITDIQKSSHIKINA